MFAYINIYLLMNMENKIDITPAIYVLMMIVVFYLGTL